MGVTMDNDTRGWIMCITSSIACLLGASIICVDVLVRKIPSQRNFRIQDSSDFLAASLSLSFGVMIFSALNNLLPSSKQYLIEGGLSKQAASWILLACFVAGMIGIQVISSLLHDYIPSHAVNCDHVHEETAHDHSHRNARKESHKSHNGHTHGAPISGPVNGAASESTPLLPENGHVHPPNGGYAQGRHGSLPGPLPQRASEPTAPKGSLSQVPNRIISFVKGTKANCDESGPCYGYSDPCGRDCFRHLGTKIAAKDTPDSSARRPSTTHPDPHIFPTRPSDDIEAARHGSSRASISSGTTVPVPNGRIDEAVETDEEADIHHHHVPENAFMSLGMQTSIAIALHKLPEGFITYATNHANPSLGFSVFTALFIHNITEGFSLALPLFLALHSRGQALLWSFLLGSVSQPLGAGIAATWFRIAGRDGSVPGAEAYGCMFAVTAGIMTSVALTLLLEAISLNHNRNLCIAFGFTGMAMMGMSNALKG